MLNSLKKFGNNVAEKTGRTTEYAKGKTQGFKHPGVVENYIQVLRWNRDQIPKLYDRIASIAEKHKDLAMSENKLNAEFAVMGGHEQEHPQLATYEKALGSNFNEMSENHFIYHAKLDEIRVDWKSLDSKDLVEIAKLQDKANHALTDARYWRNHRNPSKLSETESKYRQFAMEMVDSINRLREQKEGVFPDYIRRIAVAQLEYYQFCVASAERLLQTLDSVGPISPAPSVPLDPNFDMGDLGVKDEQGKNAANPNAGLNSGSAVIGGAASAPMPTPPPRAAAPPSNHRMARGLYAFSAGSADELSFNPGDTLAIIASDGDWWTAEMNGRRGLIPGNYVQMI